MRIVSKAILFGILAFLLLLGFYFSILTFISGWEFAKLQFFSYWYFILSLAVGFGIQIGLYSYLRNLVQRSQDTSVRVVAVSGTTSTLTMISCCSHYFANILPIIAASGVVTFVAQYQVRLFWVGLAANFLGIVYMLSRIQKVRSLVKL